MIIKQNENQIIRLKDVGEAVLGPQNEESGAMINGDAGVVMAVVGLPGANTIEIADEFYKRFDQLKKCP